MAPATALPSPALRNPEAETTGRGAQTSARYGWWEGAPLDTGEMGPT